jgi:aromatic-L-amino-acid/L-tryptophan decarboxylase
MTADASLGLDASREEVVARAAELILDGWRSFDHARPSEPPLDARVRELLAARLPEAPSPVLEALDDTARILDESIAQPRPRYFAFIGSSGLPVGVVADALASCFDVNLALWAAAATHIEQQALSWAGEFIGFPTGGGAFTSGGTVSNLTGLAVARQRALPDCRTSGLGAAKVAVYGSIDAHYSIKRAVELLGLGSRCLRLLPMDERRRLRTDALAVEIARDRADGVVPVAVVANAGTTLTGAVDPLDAMADICEAHGVWLHVDGAYGLPAAATQIAGERFKGIDRADSVTLDAHKWLFLPKACGVFLVRDAVSLRAAFSHRVEYLPRDHGELHPLETTLEYSRPFRALKLWLAFRVHGAAAIRSAVERTIELAGILADEVRRHDDLGLLADPELSIVAFRHRPVGVDLDEHNRRLADALQDDGRVYVASATIDGEEWLRPCIVNYRTTEDDVCALVAIAREVGAKLASAAPAPA